jgi:GNAT superfamily N-acetyltransferase
VVPGTACWYDREVTQLEFTRVTDEAVLRRFHAVITAAFAWDFEALPADPIDDYLPSLSGPVNGMAFEYWVGVADGTDVATALLRRPILDNLDLSMGDAVVHPEHRQRGYGRATADMVLRRARELGRKRFFGTVPSHTRHLDPAPASALVRAYDAKPLLTERRRLLDLTTMRAGDLEAQIAQSRSRASGYSILTWRDHTPSELVDDMARLMALMSTDPPQGDLDMEAETWDAARYREHEQSVLDRGRQRIAVAARDDRTGQLAGFTDLAVPTGAPEAGYQWSTIVASEHRGHRLGMLMKAINLQRVPIEFPSVRYLNTWNAEENSYMVAVNEELGFRPMEAWTEWGIAV